MQSLLDRIKAMGIYTLASLIKVVFGVVILGLTLTQLNIKEDPEISLVMLLIGVAVFSWGIAYFFFYGGQWLFMIQPSLERLQKDAYKASLIFGIYSLLNVLWIVLGIRNKRWGMVFLGIFVGIQIIVFNPSLTFQYDRKNS